jgi:hypothetical protein
MPPDQYSDQAKNYGGHRDCKKQFARGIAPSSPTHPFSELLAPTKEGTDQSQKQAHKDANECTDEKEIE